MTRLNPEPTHRASAGEAIASGAASRTDGQLLSAARKDPRALEELLRRSQRMLRGVAFAVLGDTHDVDDTLQQVYVRVWQQLSHGRGPEDGAWQAWLYRMTRNAAVDFLRSRRRQRRLADRFKDWLGWGGVEPDSSHRLAGQEEHDAVLRKIAGMPEKYRQVLVLRHLEDWDYQQIAAVLGLSSHAVETRLVRARRMLRKQLDRRVSGEYERPR